MTFFRQTLFVFPLVLLIGCTESPTSLVKAPVFPRFSATSLWSGGQVQLTAPAFAPPAPLPTVLVGSDTAAVRRVNDTTLAVQLPIATGTFEVHVIMPGLEVAIPGVVTLHGFQSEVAGPFMSGQVRLLNPGDPSPLVLASGDSGAVVLDLAANTVVSTIPDSISSPDCAQSPGLSYRGPTYFVFEGAIAGICRTPIAWQAYPSLVVADTSPIFVFQWYVMAEVGPARWFVENNNHAWFWNCVSLPCSNRTTYDVDGVYNVLLSPSDSLFAWMPSSSPGSVPPSAFRVSTMDTARVFPGIGSLLAAQFSASGDTLFAVAQSSSAVPTAYTPLHVAALRTTDGSVVRDQPLDSLGLGAAVQQVYAIAADPSHPWLYALVGYVENSAIVPTLVVVDRGTWSVVGVMSAKGASPAAVDDLVFGGTGWVIPAPALHKVFVVAAKYGYNVHQHHAAILEFDTP